MELVPALDVKGDCKEPHMLQELIVTYKAWRAKQVQQNLNFDQILVEYDCQADYNFHDKSKLAWESRIPCVSVSELFHWIAAANILHAVRAAVRRGTLGSFVATWTDLVVAGSLHFAWLLGWILQAYLAWNHPIHWLKYHLMIFSTSSIIHSID
uniref:Uncharacterized protein n=1 Tax=Daphnia galeata TaxID=27404 RepID=A0A8J2RVL5_9CRUS|nr:unnamed protein product [Daphnia galeata]